MKILDFDSFSVPPMHHTSLFALEPNNMITSDLAIDSQNMDPINDKTEQSRFKRIKIANTVQKGRWSCTDSVLVKSKHNKFCEFYLFFTHIERQLIFALHL